MSGQKIIWFRRHCETVALVHCYTLYLRIEQKMNINKIFPMNSPRSWEQPRQWRFSSKSSYVTINKWSINLTWSEVSIYLRAGGWGESIYIKQDALSASSLRFYNIGTFREKLRCIQEFLLYWVISVSIVKLNKSTQNKKNCYILLIFYSA